MALKWSLWDLQPDLVPFDFFKIDRKNARFHAKVKFLLEWFNQLSDAGFKNVFIESGTWLPAEAAKAGSKIFTKI